ncbi:hypothetical protein Nepgr_024910 [Nepenthes gracilis]|uniref:non-specific serine/threonine protein kinase n=1 Tax=Nepenthes gracilis TaxID=150966 RepID=A0AAD3XZ25_NEPGR|nr:hypothetical protein Nepgr_024910 [Nepenthes gracilis]
MFKFFVVLFALFLFLNAISSAQRDEFFYDGFSKAGNNITLNGSAKLVKDGIIQLTNTTNRVMGHAFYGFPIRFKNSANDTGVFSFSTAFTFATVPEFKSLGGHGFAFTVSPSNNLSWALPSQYLGLFNSINMGNFTNHVFAVEFDTVQDFEFNDINDNHIGIDLNSLVSNFSVPVAYFTENSTKVNVTMKSGSTIQAWIDYDSANCIVNVTISPFRSKPKLPLISYSLNLSTIFLEHMFVGFSGSTGLLASSHYILGWSFNMSGPAQSLSMAAVPSLASSSHKPGAILIALSVSFSLVLLLGIVITSIYLVRKIKNRDIVEEWERRIGPHRYSYKELKHATKGFRDKELLGRGGFGRVYKGFLQKSGVHVAVKRISHESRQGLREFVSEIASIGRLRHRNLVPLFGWCRRRGDLLLVYEYMPNGSLDKHLFDEPKLVLSWEQRFKIVKGVASGLCYLHEGWEQVVIHRDIKASNVLLDGELNGRLGDFGLARLHDHGSNLSTTRVVGTLGYLAPELPRTGKATTCSDVFAFGTLLLEVVCGRRPIEPEAQGEELVLMDWVWDKWRQGRIVDVIDPKLQGRFNMKEAVIVLKLGLMCSSDKATARPTARQVVRYLEGEATLPSVLGLPNESGDSEGFEDFVHTMVSSSYDLMSLNSDIVGDASSDNAYGFLPTSPLPFLPVRGVTT